MCKWNASATPSSPPGNEADLARLVGQSVNIASKKVAVPEPTLALTLGLSHGTGGAGAGRRDALVTALLGCLKSFLAVPTETDALCKA